MIRRLFRALLLAGLVVAGAATDAFAQKAAEPPARDWPQDGIFGRYDKEALQRGFQVFKEVCATCHAVSFLRFRDLAGIGLDQASIKALAAEFSVTDCCDENGEPFERPARPTDRYPPPYPNEQAARAANGGALPPDLSLIVKAREGGADYIYALLTGYGDPPADKEPPGEGVYWNPYFPGGWIAMPPPLMEDLVEYPDGTPATVEQMASDVTQFLAWLADPTMEERKRTGLKYMLFVLVLTGLFYAYKRKIWSKLH